MNTRIDGKWSFIACIVYTLAMYYASLVYYPRNQKWATEATISYDAAGYYWYLPSTFIYHDLKGQHFADSILKKYIPTPEFMEGYRLPNGNYVLKYSSGLAVMMLPFFLVAHFLAEPLGYPADGFSFPYQTAVQFAGLLVGLLGLWQFRRLLRYYFNDDIVACGLLILVFGTNYPVFSAINPGMTHGWLFTIYVLILLCTRCFYEQPTIKYAIFIGLLCGLAALTRPTDGIAVMLPLLWGLESIKPKALLAHLLQLIGRSRYYIVMFICMAIVVSIQFIYWKYASGHWIEYSYQDQRLYFRSPSFYNYTFSFRSGWLLYTPMMLLAFAGVPTYLWKGRSKVAIISFFLINYYLVCAWQIWWYGGRAMVQSYPILMFPLLLLVSEATHRRWTKYAVLPVLALFIYLNIWHIHATHRGDLIQSSDFNTEAYYRHIVTLWKRDKPAEILKDNAVLFNGQVMDSSLLWQNDLEKDTSASTRQPINGQRSLLLTDADKLTKEYKFASVASGYKWLKAEATFRSDVLPAETWMMSQLIINVYQHSALQKTQMYRVHRFLEPGKPQRLSIYMLVSNIKYDSIGIGIYNGGNTGSIWVDDMRVWGLK